MSLEAKGRRRTRRGINTPGFSSALGGKRQRKKKSEVTRKRSNPRVPGDEHSKAKGKGNEQS